MTPAKKPKLAFKPRMFADFHFVYGDEDTHERVYLLYKNRCHSAYPKRLTEVLVLPADTESVEALTELIFDSIVKTQQPQAQEDHIGPSWEELQTYAVLAALGFKPKAAKR